MICAATPILIDFCGSARGPLVGRWQPGFEQQKPTRLASCSITEGGKSSLMIQRVAIRQKGNVIPLSNDTQLRYRLPTLLQLLFYEDKRRFVKWNTLSRGKS